MKVDCPTCKTSVEWSAENSHRPFCSKRCQLIDLGEWADEQHTIASKNEQQDFEIDPELVEEMLSKADSVFFREEG